MDRYNYRKMFLAILPISRYSQQVSTNIINLKIKSFRRAAKEVRGQCHQLKEKSLTPLILGKFNRPMLLTSGRISAGAFGNYSVGDFNVNLF